MKKANKRKRRVDKVTEDVETGKKDAVKGLDTTESVHVSTLSSSSQPTKKKENAAKEEITDHADLHVDVEKKAKKRRKENVPKSDDADLRLDVEKKELLSPARADDHDEKLVKVAKKRRSKKKEKKDSGKIVSPKEDKVVKTNLTSNESEDANTGYTMKESRNDEINFTPKADKSVETTFSPSGNKAAKTNTNSKKDKDIKTNSTPKEDKIIKTNSNPKESEAVEINSKESKAPKKGFSPKDRKAVKNGDLNQNKNENIVNNEKKSSINEKKAVIPKELSLQEMKRAEKEESKDDSKVIRATRRAERKQLEGKVPKTDPNGVAYTKQERRRMRKRIERGLDPIETEREKQTRLQQEKELRREEEAELAGVIYRKKRNGGDDGTNESEDEENDEATRGNVKENINKVESDHEGSIMEDETDDMNDKKDTKQTANAETATKSPKTDLPIKRRNKTVPSDYICLACQNKIKPAHWIHDCPEKVTRPGSNRLSKKLKGVSNPERKVLVSGLPFDANQHDVIKLFRTSCGRVMNCKLLVFPDTKRCNGQAYVTFESNEGARKALLMDGSAFEDDMLALFSKNGATKKDLKLKVTKALNKLITNEKTKD